METWKPVPGYEGLYEVSDGGSVRSLDHTVRDLSGRWRHIRGRILKATEKTSDGYMIVGLFRHGERTLYLVHRLVLEVFRGPPPPGWETCHNDGVRNNNKLANLRWDTRRNNQADREKHGTKLIGEDHQTARLSNATVRKIKKALHPYRRHERLPSGVAVRISQAYKISKSHLSDIRHGRKRVVA